MGSYALVPLRGFFLVLFFALLIVKVFALVDCLTVPERAFVAAGKQTKVIWTVILVVAVLATFGGFLSVLGLIAALVYLLDVRPAVRGGSSYDRW
jgi:di/tricarboxylate transporter